MITQPGFYEIPAKGYHSDPCETPSLSSSVAVQLLKTSPAHVKHSHPRLSAPTAAPTAESTAESDGMAFGSVVHELLLGKGGGFAVWEGDTWRGKEASSFWDNAIAAEKTPIKAADFGRANRCALAAVAQLEQMGLGYVLREGVSEKVAVWNEGKAFCRAMFDRHIPERHEVWDIKTTARGAHPEDISRTIARLDYHTRAMFYLRGAEKLTGIPARSGGYGFCFLFIETEAPFQVVPCYLDESFQAHGRQRASRAIDIWARCMESQEWPGYVSGPVEISAPGYIDYELEDSLIGSNGGEIV